MMASKHVARIDGPPAAPQWLPDEAVTLRAALLAERPDDAQLRAFFDAPGLADFWDRVGSGSLRADAVNYLCASILNPLKLYGSTGTAERPSSKVKIRKRQQRADALMERAASLTRDLARALRELDQTSPYLPDELHLIALLRLTTGLEFDEVPSYFDGIKVVDALDRLATALEQHPPADAIFAGVPGMQSQKATWRDWLREATDNVHDYEVRSGVDFSLREADWVALAQTLVSKDISRSAVNKTLSPLSAPHDKK